MLDIITRFVQDVTSAPEPEAVLRDRKQLAEAALMYHVIAVDGVINDEEKHRLAEVLVEHFDLGKRDVQELISEARIAEQEAIDLYKFTSVLKNELEEQERISIIENLWEMVFADGVIHELEDNVVWRIAELLAVDARDRMALKKRVWQRRSEKEGQN